jgi:hypothetical protein
MQHLTFSVTDAQWSEAQLGIRVDAVVRQILTHARAPILDMQPRQSRNEAKVPDARPISEIQVLDVDHHQGLLRAK